MTIGVYSITNKIDGKRYIGKSINIEQRLTSHRRLLSKDERSEKHTNRYLFNAVKAHGIENFVFEVVEEHEMLDEKYLGERELYWMDFYKTCNRGYGYNLRRDTSTKSIVHDETRQLIRKMTIGPLNPNYGNKWTDDMKKDMSEKQIKRHKNGVYGQSWKDKSSASMTRFWENNPDVKKAMINKLKKSKQKYNFHQMDENGKVLKVWGSIDEIIDVHPEWKWQNIYSVCNGYKKRIYGYKWKKVLK